MPGSRRHAAMPRMTTSGYIAMRWYQHSAQGTNPATSDRYRLPAVAVSATANASHRAMGPTCRRTSSIRPSSAEPTSAMRATPATRARSARNVVTTSVILGPGAGAGAGRAAAAVRRRERRTRGWRAAQGRARGRLGVSGRPRRSCRDRSRQLGAPAPGAIELTLSQRAVGASDDELVCRGGPCIARTLEALLDVAGGAARGPPDAGLEGAALAVPRGQRLE